jgi:hypothetical protein
MEICSRCNGEGYEYFVEDFREFRDACYHCGTTGMIDDNKAYHDKIHKVAVFLAHCEVEDYRKAVDSNPDGEGWEFRAAESMMSGWELYQSCVYNYAEEYHYLLTKMDLEGQDLLIAWHNQVLYNIYKNPPAVNFVPKVTYQADLYQVDNDEIPF